MRLSRKLLMVSVAALMGVSPVLGAAANEVATVSAVSTSRIYMTNGKKSRITATRTVRMVNRYGKKTNRVAKRNGKYLIWRVSWINGGLYYAIQSDLKYWLPASATAGTVHYRSGKHNYQLTTNGTSSVNGNGPVMTTAKKVANRQTSSKTTKKAVKKSSKKATKKARTAKKSTSSKKVTYMTTIRKAVVYNAKGKAVKTYLGSAKNTPIGKNVTLRNLGTKTIKGTKYYALKPNAYYVKASDVKAGK